MKDPRGLRSTRLRDGSADFSARAGCLVVHRKGPAFCDDRNCATIELMPPTIRVNFHGHIDFAVTDPQKLFAAIKARGVSFDESFPLESLGTFGEQEKAKMLLLQFVNYVNGHGRVSQEYTVDGAQIMELPITTTNVESIN